jgi:hypothetical protein
MNVLLADDHRVLLEGQNDLLTAHGVHGAGWRAMAWKP